METSGISLKWKRRDKKLSRVKISFINFIKFSLNESVAPPIHCRIFKWPSGKIYILIMQIYHQKWILDRRVFDSDWLQFL